MRTTNPALEIAPGLRDPTPVGFQVSVALATYNGARYIADQLASLARQSLLPTELVVSDDGSTDETVAIIQDFAASAPFPVALTRNEQRLGFGDNFIQAAQRTRAPWVAFCDQDDEWDPGKLMAAHRAIAGDPEILLVTHPSRVMRNDQLTQERVGPRTSGTYPPLTLHPLHVYNGHSLVFRRLLLDVLPPQERAFSAHAPERRMPHDDWITFLGGALGRTHILPDALVSYRYHEGNASSAFARRTGWRDQLRRARMIDAVEIERYRMAAEGRVIQLQHVTSDLPFIRDNARRAVSYYQDLSALSALRAELWRAPAFSRRLAVVAALIARGGYRGFAHGGMGAREGLKDVVFGLAYGGAKRGS